MGIQSYRLGERRSSFPLQLKNIKSFKCCERKFTLYKLVTHSFLGSLGWLISGVVTRSSTNLSSTDLDSKFSDEDSSRRKQKISHFFKIKTIQQRRRHKPPVRIQWKQMSTEEIHEQLQFTGKESDSNSISIRIHNTERSSEEKTSL